jgi:hypothetical protein
MNALLDEYLPYPARPFVADAKTGQLPAIHRLFLSVPQFKAL